jgi:hypothetical protein
VLTPRQQTYLDENPSAARIWRAIKRRDGGVITRREFVVLTGLSDRTVRRLLEELNVNSFPIIPDFKIVDGRVIQTGGHRLGDKGECELTAAVLRKKSQSMNRRASGLENCYPEPELSQNQRQLFDEKPLDINLNR